MSGRWHRLGLAAAVLVGCGWLAACGSDDGDDGAAGTTTTTEVDDASTDAGPSVTDSGGDEGDGNSDSAGPDGVPPPTVTGPPEVDVDPLPPAPVGEPVDFGTGLVTTVTKVEKVDLQSQAPGETSGPGVLVTLELRNGTPDPVPAIGVAINATYGPESTPAIPHRTGPIQVFEGTLAPGETATAVYAFRVPEEHMGSIVLDVHHSGQVSYVIVEVGGAVQ